VIIPVNNEKRSNAHDVFSLLLICEHKYSVCCSVYFLLNYRKQTHLAAPVGMNIHRFSSNIYTLRNVETLSDDSGDITIHDITTTSQWGTSWPSLSMLHCNSTIACLSWAGKQDREREFDGIGSNPMPAASSPAIYRLSFLTTIHLIHNSYIWCPLPVAMKAIDTTITPAFPYQCTSITPAWLQP
jgi:hypothetical protein